jgi:hypothetical protein
VIFNRRKFKEIAENIGAKWDAALNSFYRHDSFLKFIVGDE